MHNDYTTTIAGVHFRPISCASLAWLKETRSPLLFGGEFAAIHYAVLLWMHGAPLGEVIDNIGAGTYETAAIYWASEQPPEVFAALTKKRLLHLHRLINQIYVDKKTGFIPFPAALPQETSPDRQGLIGIASLWKRIFRWLRPVF